MFVFFSIWKFLWFGNGGGCEIGGGGIMSVSIWVFICELGCRLRVCGGMN